MSFLQPLGFLALLAIPVLIIIYIIKSKYTEQVIPSTYLWELSERFLKRKNPLKAITGILSLILQILAVVCIALAIAHPTFVVKGGANDYCFVLDSSASMNIAEGNKSRFDSARDEIKKIINSSADGSTYTLITAGDTTDVVFSGLDDKKSALNQLSQLSASYAAGSLDSALMRAQKYFNANTSMQFYLVTDKNIENTENVEFIQIGGGKSNYGLSDVSYVFNMAGGGSSVTTVTGKVFSYSDNAALTVEVYLNNGSAPEGRVQVQVNGNSSTEFSVDISKTDFSSLTVSIREKGDLTEATEAHVDENGDSTCDKCNALFFAAGKYYNADYGIEIEIKANGKVLYNEMEYALSAITENAETKALFATFTADKEYTLTKTETGYELSWEFSMGGQTATIKRELAPMPEIIAEDFEQFAGVYEGTLSYNDNTVTRISITEDGHVLVTEAVAESDPVTTVKDATSVAVNYNTFSTEGWSFVAKTAENNAVKTIEITYSGVTATFTRTAEAIEEIPEALPVDAFTYYSYTAVSEEETSFSFVVAESGYYRYKLNGKAVELLNGNDTDGYLIKTLNSSYDPINYLLKVSADKSAVELYAADKTTKLATLALTEQSFPELKVDGTANDFAVTDIFNEDYAYYKVATTGWYTFTAGSNEVKIFTEVVGHLTTGSGETVVSISAGKSKTVYLEANALVAVESWKVSNSFTAEYSETEPVEEALTFTNGKFEIADFDGTQTYTIKGKTTSATKYYVTLTSSMFDSGKECLVFNVNGVDYGTYYDAASWKILPKEAGLVYSEDLASGAEVTVIVSTNKPTWDYGTVIVYFETEEEYNARLESGSTGEEETDLFSADQIGTYTYEYSNGTMTFEVEANAITVSGSPYAYLNGAMEKITYSAGVYTCVNQSYILKFSFGSNGNIVVSSDGIYDLGTPYELTKQTSSEEEPTTPVGVVGNNTVSAGKTGSGELLLNEAGVWTVTYGSGVSYILAGNGIVVDGGTVIVTAGNPITLTVYVDVANDATEAVVNLAFASSSEEPADNTLSVGDNTINATFAGIEYTFTATEAGDYTITFDGDSFVMSNDESFSSGTTVTLAQGQSLVLLCCSNVGQTATYTLTIAKAGSEEVSAKVGVNTVQAGKAGYAEITFSVPGTYTLTYDSSADNVYYIMVGGATVLNGGTFTVTDSVTIKVYASNNSATSSFTIAVAEAGGGEEETDGGLKIGVNTISEFDTIFFTANVTFTATEAGTYTFYFEKIYGSSTVSTINGTALEINALTETATATLTLEANQTITIVVEQNLSCDNITLTITKA